MKNHLSSNGLNVIHHDSREYEINWKNLIPEMNKKFGKIALWSCSKKLLNLRKRSKESLKLKAGIEQQQKEVGYGPNVTFEYENERMSNHHHLFLKMKKTFFHLLRTQAR